jgi:two-component system chemotaxis response regulator CheB
VGAVTASDDLLDLLVLGASAGGVSALSAVVAGLATDLPAGVLVVLHIAASSPSMLAQILERASPLPAGTAEDGQRIAPGHIYVAPPDLHLTVEDGTLRLTGGPRVNGHRPAVDPLLRSAGEAHGRRVIGVVLSGTGDDGTAGLAQVKARGGTALVQDPEDAHYPEMPLHALRNVEVDAVLRASEIGPVVSRLLAGGSLPPPIRDPRVTCAADPAGPPLTMLDDRRALPGPLGARTGAASCGRHAARIRTIAELARTTAVDDPPAAGPGRSA